MAQQTRAYPVYRSPDGTAEQVAATPAREVQLKHAGWVKIRQPRSNPTMSSEAAKPSSKSSKSSK